VYFQTEASTCKIKLSRIQIALKQWILFREQNVTILIFAI
jgi:hypothetical protein